MGSGSLDHFRPLVVEGIKLPHSIVRLHMFMVKSHLSWLHSYFPLSDCTFSWLNPNLKIACGKPQGARREANDPASICLATRDITMSKTNGESKQFGDGPGFSFHGIFFW